MTQAQLDALAALVSMRTGPSLLAAGLVLVEGRRPADAAREAGLSPQAVSNALARLRRALDLARQAVGADSARRARRLRAATMPLPRRRSARLR